MNIHSLFTIAILLFSGLLLAQTEAETEEHRPFKCGSEQAQQEAFLEFPELLKKQEAFEKFYQENYQRIGNEKSVVYTIPVVVHIIHAGSPLGTEANPTDAQIEADMSRTAQRFRHTHAGANTYTNPNYGSDTEIDLCLASVDPNGNYTTGITRHYIPSLSVGSSSALAPGLDAYAWDKNKYCNLFIVSNLTSACGVNVGQGFTIYDSGCFWDGLVAHELGHYFSLLHTFVGCTNTSCLTNGDKVCDTPAKAVSGYNGGNSTTCMADPINDCGTDEDDTTANNPYRAVGLGGMGEQPDMLENYMDYTGGCWDSFTEGQKTRMHMQIMNSRTTMATCGTTLCAPQPTPSNDAGITTINLTQTDACDATAGLEVTINNYGSATLTSVTVIVEANGVVVATETLSVSIAAGGQATLSLSSILTLAAGMTDIAIYTSNPNSSADANIHNDINYTQANFIGGTSCVIANDCADFNTATNSGPGNTTLINITATFPALPSSTYSVQICVTVDGDVSSSSEVFNVLDEGGTNQGTTNFGGDCAGPTTAFCFFASAADYDSWRADGTITVTLNPINTYINPTLCAGANEGCATISIPQGIDGVFLAPKVFLQGPLPTGSTAMNTDINAMIPSNSPYSDAKPMGAYTIPANAIDWVWVELRSDATAAPANSYGQSGLLLSDGTIVDVSGSNLLFSGAGVTIGSQWHILVKHRNHLGIMTANKVTLN